MYIKAMATIGIYRIDENSISKSNDDYGRENAIKACCDFLSFGNDEYNVNCANKIKRDWGISDKEIIAEMESRSNKLEKKRIKSREEYKKRKRDKMNLVL
jgi:hypothetical protein